MNIQAVVRTEEDTWKTETHVKSVSRGVATVEIQLPEDRYTTAQCYLYTTSMHNKYSVVFNERKQA